MAHKIIGYYTQSQLSELLNKPFYFYQRSEYCHGIEITDITSTETNAKFAVAVAPGDNNTYLMWIITTARTAFDITFRGVAKHSSYPYGNTSDPPKDPDSTWVSVTNFGPQTTTVTPSSHTSSIYPYTAMNFLWATINVNNYAYADSDGCVRVWDDNGILNDWDTSIEYSSANFKSYVTGIMSSPAIPPRGQGIVTLNIPINGMNLTFTSASLGVSKTVNITGDTTIDMQE